MPYPSQVAVALLEINGNSCGTLQGLMEYVEESDPPAYDSGIDPGDFSWATAWREDLGGGSYTWRLQLKYAGGGACNGLWLFQRTQNADDPTGDYCRISGGQVNCSAGKARITAV